MGKLFGTSWRTTVAGWLGGGVVAILPVLQTGHFDSKDLAIGFALGVLGTFAKDSNKTGGTQLQTGSIPDAALHKEAAQVAAVEAKAVAK